MVRENEVQIDLLITDVVVPEMDGRDLAGNIMSNNPGQASACAGSGYTANVIDHRGVWTWGCISSRNPF